MTGTSAGGTTGEGNYNIVAGGPYAQNGPYQFIFDNLLYPSDNAAGGVFSGWGGVFGAIGGNAYVDNGGLVFSPASSGGGSETNVTIWGDGNGAYSFYGGTAPNYQIAQNTNGTFLLTSTGTVTANANGLVKNGSGTLTLAGTNAGLIGNGLVINGGSVAFSGSLNLTQNTTFNLASGNLGLHRRHGHHQRLLRHSHRAGSLAVSDSILDLQNGPGNQYAIIDNATGVVTLSGAISPGRTTP